MNTSVHALAGSYNLLLVALSVLIAMFASFAALDLAGRVTSARGRARAQWLAGGATAMGIGIWSMHYVGMLAFRLPVLVLYDWPTVFASLLAAIFASAVALFVASRSSMGIARAVGGSVIMGSGIAGMHYIGMAAMRLPAMCHYSRPIVAASVALAIIIAMVALNLTFRFREETSWGGWRKLASAIVMGAAVPAMHYTGMAAASFTPAATAEGSIAHAISISEIGTTAIIAVTFMVLALVLLTSHLDRRFSAHANELASEEKWSERIIETSFDAFVAIDATGCVTQWNARAEAMFDRAFADVAGKPFSEVAIPEMERQLYDYNVEELVRSQVNGTATRRFEVKASRRSGEQFRSEITISVLESDRTHSFAAFVRDLTERELASEKFSGLLDSSSEAILFVDQNGRIAVVNSRAEELFGYSREEMLQQPVEMLVPVRYREKHPHHQAGFMNDPRVRPMGTGIELVALRKDGSEFPCDISLRPVEAQEGMLVSTVVQDITVRKEREKALKDAHDRLSTVLAESERRVQESHKLAELLDILQSCQTVQEAYKVAQSYLPNVLSCRSGALCLKGPEGNLIEVTAAWGETPATELTFRLDDCWALRRGKIHMGDGKSPLECAHVAHAPDDGYVCVPLAAQAETLGVLYLECAEGGENSAASRRQTREALAEQALAAGGRISLALANLRLREVLRSQSIRDPLTGLFNRRYMEETLDRELKRGARNKEPVSLLMFDIDYFKKFNDTFGHQAGDELLRAFGQFLMHGTRGQDVPCRYGGEEFAVVLTGAPLEGACKRAETLREGAKKLAVRHAGRDLGAISVSIGVASFPRHQTSEELMRAADQALYRAKSGGRDRVVADGTPSAAAEELRRVANETLAQK